MSFGVRVLGLVVLVTVTATAATARLTLRTATQQVRQTVTAGQAEVQLIMNELIRYGRERGDWNGVAARVMQLAEQTGQRVRLVSESGRVLADSDEHAGGPAGAPLAVDARPQLHLPTTLEPGAGVTEIPPGSGVKLTATAIGQYHRQDKVRRCLIEAGIALRIFTGAYGVVMVEPAIPSSEAALCAQSAELSDAEFARYVDAAQQCTDRDCWQKVFLRGIAAIAPEPLRVYIGTSIDRLGEGRLGDRVPVAGRDELAMLSRAFNRMAEALQESEERQRRMTADIAHELRTPLTNLRGYLEALTDGTAEPSRELFLSLRDEALLQQRIIDDLQDLALAEAGKLTYQWVRVDVSELAEGYRFAGEVDVVTHERSYVDGDPDRLRQVLNNLIRNAVTAGGPHGTVTLTVRTAGQVELVVADTGTGIAAQDLPHIFDRFWRADRARPRGSGVGLGLAIVRQIVTDHGGTIGVTSRMGVGTTFTVTLPAARHIGSR